MEKLTRLFPYEDNLMEASGPKGSALRTLMSASDELFLLFDSTGGIKYFNSAAQKNLFRPGKRPYAKINNFFPRANAGFIRETMLPAMRTNGKWQSKELLKTGAGGRLSVALTVTLIEESDGEYVFCMHGKNNPNKSGAQNPDVFFRAFFQNSAEAIYLLDLKTLRVVAANPAFLRMLGYSRQESRRLHLSDIIANDPESIRQNLERLKTTPEIDLGVRKWRRKNGRILDIDVQLTYVPYGDAGLIFVTGSDTGIKGEFDPAEERTEQFRYLVEGMNDGLIFVDQEERIQLVNDKFCELTGFSAEELRGQIASELLLDAEGREKMRQTMKEREKGISGSFELLVTKKTGEKIWMENSGSPFVNESGEVVGSIGILRDITEQKKAEEILIKRKEELDAFVYQASHDLKAPLASLKGLLGLAEIEVYDPAAVTYFQMMRKTADKMDELLMGLLELTMIKQGKLDYTTINLQEMTGEILDGIKHSPYMKNARFVQNFSHPFLIPSDPNLLHSILQNLLYNAFKYHREEGTDNFVELSAERKGEEIILVVRDNGPGIDVAAQDKIFDMFYRVAGDSKGSGLGLYIVKSALEKLGGKIKLTSAVGKGAEFTLRIPDHEHG